MSKDIAGYEGIYFVTEDGRVFAHARDWICGNGAKRHIPEHELAYTTDKKYKRVTLVKNSTYKSFSVHRLVAEAFIPNPENKPTVDHINRDKLNNSISNLRWATYKEQSNNREK